VNIGVNIEFRELKIAQFGTTEESIDGTHTCSNTDQFLSQPEKLQVKFRILEANVLRFGVPVP